MTIIPPDEASTARLARMARAEVFEAQQRDKLQAQRAKDAYTRKVARQFGEPLPQQEAARRLRKFKAELRATRAARQVTLRAVLLLASE